MTPELNKIIAERLAILPQALQARMLDATGLRQQMMLLGKQHNLTREQTIAVENEVVLTLLAFTPYHDLPVNIAREFGVEESVVLPVVGSILSDICTPEILNELEKLPISETSQHIPAPAPTPSPPMTPPTTAIPQYQRPLTSLPQYRNADLYQNPQDEK